MRQLHIIYGGGYEPELLSVGQVVEVLSDNKPNLFIYFVRGTVVLKLY